MPGQEEYERKYLGPWMAARSIVGKCRRIEYIGGKNLAPFSDEIYKHSERLYNILSWEHLLDQFMEIQSLKPSPKSTASAKKIEQTAFILKNDIQEFYNIFGNIANNLYKIFRSAKTSKDSETFPEIEGKLLIRFCTNVHDLLKVWEQLYLRIDSLEEMIEPKGKSKYLYENPLEQLEEIHKGSIILRHKYLADTQLRERLMDVRNDNRKLNLILRESDLELSEVELDQLKFVKKVVASKDAEEGILTSASRALKSFERKLTKFRINSKAFRMRSVQKCLEYEEMLMDFMATENIFKPDLTQDPIISEKMTEFFGIVVEEYKMYSNELDLLKIEFKKQCDLYM